MMDGMYPGGLAMMIFGSAAALAVLALVILAIAWLAGVSRDAIHDQRQRCTSCSSSRRVRPGVAHR